MKITGLAFLPFQWVSVFVIVKIALKVISLNQFRPLKVERFEKYQFLVILGEIKVFGTNFNLNVTDPDFSTFFTQIFSVAFQLAEIRSKVGNFKFSKFYLIEWNYFHDF